MILMQCLQLQMIFSFDRVSSEYQQNGSHDSFSIVWIAQYLKSYKMNVQIDLTSSLSILLTVTATVAFACFDGAHNPRSTLWLFQRVQNLSCPPPGFPPIRGRFRGVIPSVRSWPRFASTRPASIKCWNASQCCREKT